MQSLPLVISLVIAAGVVSPVCRSLVELGLTQKNYRGQPVAFPAGIAILIAAFLALVPLSLVQELADANVFRPGVETALIYVVGVALLGLLDDLIGSGVLTRGEAAPGTRQPLPRGWRGHARAIAGGRLSTFRMSGLSSLLMRTSIAVALLLASVCAYGQGGGPLPDRTPRPRVQWQRFFSNDDRFSIAMPGKPAYPV